MSARRLQVYVARLVTKGVMTSTPNQMGKCLENQLRSAATWLPDVSFWVTRFPAVLTALATIFAQSRYSGTNE